MKKELNIAMIGTGFMGKAHSYAWQNVDKFYDVPFKPVLKAVTGGHADKAEAFAKNWGYEESVKNWTELIDRPDIDVVCIVTPTYLHKDVAVAAAKAGKHVFCEKPCAMDYQAAKEMLQAAEQAGIVHYLNHNYRRAPAVAYAKQLIDEGRLGTIFHWRGAYLQDWIIDPEFPLTWHFQTDKAGGGASYDLTSHAVDLARYLIGEMKAVTAVNKTFVTERPLPGEGAATFTSGSNASAAKGKVGVDDASFAIAEFENGALGSFETSRFATGRKNHNVFEVYGSLGALTFDLERMNELNFLDYTAPSDEQGFRNIQVNNMSHPYAGAWWAPGHGLGYENTFVNAVADFLKAIATKSKIAPDFSDGEMIMRVIGAIRKSSDTQKRVEISELS